MPSISISDLARKLNITNTELLDKAIEYGIDIGKKAIKINDKLAEQFIQKYKENQKRIKNKEKINRLKEGVESEKKIIEKPLDEKIISIPKNIVVHEFAQKLNIPVTKAISLLMKNGVFVNLNQSIDFDIASIIAEEVGYKTKYEEVDAVENLNEKLKASLKTIIKEKNSDIESDLIYRPPVVVVMGHVDHGKTKLLDAIANTHKIEKESGGITQHIGAFQIEKNGRLITFIDTPGHEAFQKMRTRGGEVADVAILVVAANEGIKQQTIEAIKIIEQEKIPFIVAINKIDLPDANIDKVKSDLAELNLIPEDWGGNVICAQISAVKNIGIDELLDLVLLAVDIEKDSLLTNISGDAMGIVIESRIDKNEGVKATVILETGTLKRGDNVIVNGVYGRARVLRNDKGEQLESVQAGNPVEILGLKQVPFVGDIMQVVSDKSELKKKLKEYSYLNSKDNRSMQSVVISRGNNENKDLTSINIIIKADYIGSSEALKDSFEKITKESDINVAINIIKNEVGNVNENDIFLADQTNSIILAFSVPISPLASMIAREKKVKIKGSKIIYELTDFIYDELDAILPTNTKVTLYAKAKVLKIFSYSKKIQIIGCSIQEGEIENKASFWIKNGTEIVTTGLVDSLRVEKNEVKKVVPGNECGMAVKTEYEIKEGDVLEFYTETQIKQKLNRK